MWGEEWAAAPPAGHLKELRFPNSQIFSPATLLLTAPGFPYLNLVIPTLPPARIKMAVLNTTFISLHLIAYFHPLKKKKSLFVLQLTWVCERLSLGSSCFVHAPVDDCILMRAQAALAGLGLSLLKAIEKETWSWERDGMRNSRNLGEEAMNACEQNALYKCKCTKFSKNKNYNLTRPKPTWGGKGWLA